MFLSFLSISPSVDLQIDQMMEQDKRFTRFLPVTLDTQFRWEQQTKAIYDKNRKTKHQIKCAHRKCTQIIVILSQLDSFILIAIWFFFSAQNFYNSTRSKMHSIRNISDFFYLRNPIWRSIKNWLCWWSERKYTTWWLAFVCFCELRKQWTRTEFL